MKPTPIMAPMDWRGRESTYCHPLLDIDAPGMPLVAYGEDSEHQTEYVMKEDLADAAAEAQVKAEAADNFRAHIGADDSERMIMKADGGLAAYFMVTGDDTTASHIVEPEFLNKMHDELSSKTLYVGIPNRNTCLIGTDCGDIEAFTGDHYGESDAGTVKLSADVFKVEGGKVVDVAVIKDQEFYDNSVEVPSAYMGEHEGQTVLFIEIDCGNSQQILDDATLALDGYAHVLAEEESFTGGVVFKVSVEAIDDQLQEFLDELGDQLTEFAASSGMTTAGGDKIVISFVQDEANLDLSELLGGFMDEDGDFDFEDDEDDFDYDEDDD